MFLGALNTVDFKPSWCKQEQTVVCGMSLVRADLCDFALMRLKLVLQKCMGIFGRNVVIFILKMICA